MVSSDCRYEYDQVTPKEPKRGELGSMANFKTFLTKTLVLL